MSNRGGDQPVRRDPYQSSISEFLENDEPSSADFYRMTAKHLPSITKARSECDGGSSDLHWKGPAPANYEQREKQKQSLKIEMAAWLDDLAPWDWFSTYTFANPVTANGAHHMLNRHFEWLEKQAGVPVYAFRADEYYWRDLGRMEHLLHIEDDVKNKLLPKF